VAVLVDTSLSMAMTDGESPSAAGTVSRPNRRPRRMGRSDLLDRLRKVHDVAVFPSPKN